MAEMGAPGSSEYLLQENQQSVAFGAPPPQQLQPVVQVQSQQGINKNAITPHSYLALSICVAICCGILNPLTLVCTIPAAVLSAMSYLASANGNLIQSKRLGNRSLILIMSGLVSGLVVLFVFFLTFVTIYVRVSYCGSYYPSDRQDICSRMF